ncbi:MAG TPA: hypothetical protein VK776_12405 [Bryobacteraceae bacterium]|nr:hypothetical protein [Bryobacteraceae bacterium]
MTILISAFIVVALLIAAFTMLFARLASRLDKRTSTAEWFESFSLDNFSPMERLLDQSDFEFLSRQPGYRPEIGARLLKERKQLFLSYLQLLIGDFNQLLRIARLMIVHSAEDRADFAKVLWRQQVTFYLAVCAVRLRVAVYPLGWTSLDVSRLTSALENMRNQVAQLGFQPITAAQSA